MFKKRYKKFERSIQGLGAPIDKQPKRRKKGLDPNDSLLSAIHRR